MRNYSGRLSLFESPRTTGANMFPYGLYGYTGYMGEEVPITTSKPTCCDGCDKIIDKEESYLVMAGSHAHMIEECITKVYDKVKADNTGFELSVRG